MKKFIIVSLSILCISLAWAATEKWSYPTDAVIYQTYADGAGGCAVFFIATNGTGRISWLDKKGTEIYSKEVKPAFPSPIIVCNKKNLIFSVSPTGDLPYLIAVDAKGSETELSLSRSAIYPANLPGMSVNVVLSDKKGFFTQGINTNNNLSTLYRYNYK